jgi:hypothetical protein
MAVSLPEKTLEHWTSQFIGYRFRTYAHIWWPAAGVDVDVLRLPGHMGKAVQLELKTAELTGPDQHAVSVDLGQLWKYVHRPLALQPFYVFPIPTWRGEFADAAARARRSVSESAYRRSGPDWWFGDWLWVLTTQELARVVGPRLHAHGSGRLGTKARVVRIDLAGPTPAKHWTHRSPRRGQLMQWPSFWNRLVHCGEADWPQFLQVPAQAVGSSEVLDRGAVNALRSRELRWADRYADDQLVRFIPTGQDSFVRQEWPPSIDDPGPPVEPADDDYPGASEHRAIVFFPITHPSLIR